MKEKNGGTPTPEGQKTVWGFFVLGILFVLAGSFVHVPGTSISLPKAEILTGSFLIVGAVAALLITS